MYKILILLMGASLPTSALAQGFEGAAGEFQYQKYDDGDGFEIDSLEGNLDAAWSFGTLGAQVGLSIGKEIDNSDDIDFGQFNGVTAHLTADVSDSLRVGVMAHANNQVDDIAFYAAEALYLGGPLRIESRIGDSLDTDDFTLFEAKGAYAIGTALSARAGLHYSDYGSDGSYRVLSLGAGYKVNDGMEVYADVSRHRNDFGAGDVYNGNLINLGVRFGLGGDSDRLFTYQPLN